MCVREKEGSGGSNPGARLRLHRLPMARTRVRGLDHPHLRFRVQGPGFRVQGSGFKVQDPGSGFQGPGSSVQGPGSRVWGSGRTHRGARAHISPLLHLMWGGGGGEPPPPLPPPCSLVPPTRGKHCARIALPTSYRGTSLMRNTPPGRRRGALEHFDARGWRCILAWVPDREVNGVLALLFGVWGLGFRVWG